MSKVVSLKGIHDDKVQLPKAQPAQPAMEATAAAGPVKVVRLDGTVAEVDPTQGSTWTMPRLAHPEKLVSNKAEALRKFAERKAREGKVDPAIQKLAAAAAEEAAKKGKPLGHGPAVPPSTGFARKGGQGRVVTLSGAEPRARVGNPRADAAPRAQVQLKAGGAIGKRKFGADGAGAAPSVFERLGGGIGSTARQAHADARALISGKRQR